MEPIFFTRDQAFYIIFSYLEKLAQRMRSTGIRALLNNLTHKDYTKKPYPAAWQKWQESLEKTTGNLKTEPSKAYSTQPSLSDQAYCEIFNVNIKIIDMLLNMQEARDAMIFFISIYANNTKSADAKQVITDLLMINFEMKTPAHLYEKFIQCLHKARILVKSQNSSNPIIIDNQNMYREQEAFEAMIYFLEDYYLRTNSDDLGGHLSDLLHAEYGSTADPACWEEWQDSLEKIKCARQD